MKTPIAWLFLSIAMHGGVSVALGNAQIPNFDRRTEGFVGPQNLSIERSSALADLRVRIPTVQVQLDDILASPKFIYARDGFLSAPDTEEGTLPPQTLEMVAAKGANPAAARDPHRAIKRFVDENSSLLGYDSTMLGTARMSRDYVTEHSGLRTVIWEQYLEDIPIFEAVLYGSISKIGELVAMSTQFVPNPAEAATRGTPNRLAVQAAPVVSAAAAVAEAAADIGESLQLQAFQVANPNPLRQWIRNFSVW